MKRLLRVIPALIALVALAFALTWRVPDPAAPAVMADWTMEASRQMSSAAQPLRLDGPVHFGPATASLVERVQGLTGRQIVFAAYSAEDRNRDVFSARAQFDVRGHLIGLTDLANLTGTADGDETQVTVSSTGKRLAYGTRVGNRFQLVTALALDGTDRLVLALSNPSSDLSLAWESDSLLAIRPAGGTVVRLDAAAATMQPADAPVRLLVQTPGELPWLPRLVNTVREHPWVGPEKIAFLENLYFFLVDVWQRATYRSPAEPSPTEPADAVARPESTPSHTAVPSAGLVTPGTTPTSAATAAATPTRVSTPSGMDKRMAFMPPELGLPHRSVYPDRNRPFAKAEVITIDPARFDLHLVGGTWEPRSTTGIVGTGVIPDDEATRRDLVAAFNGGWAAMHGHYGMMIDRQVFLPAREGIATLAWYTDGSLRLGVWGRNIQPSPDIVSFRQNCLPLIENGSISPELGKLSLWGLSVSDEAVIYRSGLGQTRDGKLIYVAGNALSALTLAQVLYDAGAYNAMQLDIDDFHVAFITYQQVLGKDGKVQVVGTKLRQDMQGFDGLFLKPFALDFFYLTRKAVPGAPAVPTSSPTSTPLSTPTRGPALPSLAGRIAFQSARDGNWEIYSMRPDGSAPTRLTEDPADDLYPAWYPDGSRLAFTSGRHGSWDIYTMPSEGGAPVRVTQDPGNEWYPAWSPDGRHIAFQTDREGNAEIYSADASGNGALTKLTRFKGNNERPTWSPDGLRLAFDSDFLAYGTVSSGIDLYVMQVGSTLTPTKLMTHAEYPAWSPDGARIAFHAELGGSWDIYTVRADGTGLVRVTSHPADDRYPAWSPDGRWIAFSSNRDGPWEVYVTLADGTGPTYRLTYGGGVHPSWGR